MATQQWQTIGFEKYKSFFVGAIADRSLAHAYIFKGQEMAGKRTFALDLARKLVGDDIHPRNQNLLIVDPAHGESLTSISIDQIRDLKRFFVSHPYGTDYKIAIIDDAHLMTEEAQNALLKVLEEPPAFGVLILVSHRADDLLQTLRSRSQTVEFAPHSLQSLRQVVDSTELPEQTRQFLISFSNGRIGLMKDIIAKAEFQSIKDQLAQLNQIKKANAYERLLIAQKMAEIKTEEGKPEETTTTSASKTALYWLLYLRMGLAENNAYAPIARTILDYYQRLQEPQFNKRLLLESLMLSL